MEVCVKIETKNPPTKARMNALHKAADRLTDYKSSIHVTHKPTQERHCLIAQFTMRTAAEYKVVDDIAKEFKMEMWDFDDYLDMSISFLPT